MKRLISIVLVLIIAGFIFPGAGLCGEMSNYELMEELKAVKEKTKILEDRLNKQEKVEAKEGTAEEGDKFHGGAEDKAGIPERVHRIEKQMEKKDVLAKWAERITFSGLIEVEAGYEDMDFDDPAEDDEKSSDISLATVELGVDVDIVKHVKGHVLFLYEEGEDIVVDEGIISIDGEDVVPLYLNAGKLYVPFGYYESHFISDPLTLELGETRESAIVAGFANDMFDLSLGVFNGDINKTDKDNDHIDNFVASAVFTLPEDTVSGLGLTVGGSWISDIADSNGLQDVLDEAGTDEIEDYVPAWSAFLSVSFLDKFFFEAEYIAATDKFENDDLALAPGERFEPKAWNLELAYAVIENLEFAIKYEGSSDALNFVPEKQYGAAVTYGLFENTSLALEYLHGTFENDDERDLITAQLAIEF
ncbi:MAG: hypothetical protein B1H12_05560 [Desulfobacteraceae bacterium 4484_190.2]|nr:MAG: hypothetical protein B1H12_05560 [Desulfobacteraceae bacterium 4484_190.2]